MSEENKGAGSAAGQAGSEAGSGSSDHNHSTPQGDQGNQGDNKGKGTVSFESYQKVLDQKKRADAKLAELEAQANAAKQREMEEKQQYKTLYEETKKRLDETETKFGGLKKERIDDFKIAAFVQKLPAPLLKDEYLAHANIKEIIFDEETQSINEDSVKKVADDFVKNHSFLLKTSSKNDLPNDAPGRKAGGLSYQEWLRLPKAEKEKRIKEVRD